ncbi:FMN-dependent NADH-azoreductase [Lactococcus nasutitermitis]|uniref:FMN dependent NADH:quinone oxidoreductase n=1 Tax=Lactococcus nasutitermitis TaxID=1652957 RepID=A0ABV9JEL3_9LACT|nr:FMN-dependent NADH-azoreductase [Lactococcus nasutitermitis]
MSTLLVILSHPHTTDFSYSLATADKFIASYKLANPNDTIIIRDLFDEENPVPALSNEVFSAWTKQKFTTEALTAVETKLLEAHTEFLDEFLVADKYVFVNPMYNHFLPAELKQYIDVTAVARKTFRYTENGPEGLLKGKKALHIQAAGGYYHDENGMPLANSHDFGSAYLQATMRLYGLGTPESLYVEGYARYPERAEEIKAATFAKAEALGKTF